MIILIHGEDTYRSHERVMKLKEAFLNKYSKTGINLITLDGAGMTLDEFQKNCFTAGLLEKRRLILIKNLISQGKDAKLLEGVIDLLQKNKFPEENIIIFWEDDLKEEKPKIKSGKNLKKALLFELKKHKIEEYDYLVSSQLKKWVSKEIKTRKGKISPDALEELVAKVGQDLWQMNNEIEKLINFCRGRAIQKEDVANFVQTKFDENIFHLTDALGERQKEKALKLIHVQLKSGTEPLLLLAKFIWHFRNLIQIKDLINQNFSQKEIVDKLSLHPFVVQKTIFQAKKFTFEELKEIYRELQEVDLKLKNSVSSPELLFDLLVFSVCK